MNSVRYECAAPDRRVPTSAHGFAASGKGDATFGCIAISSRVPIDAYVFTSLRSAPPVGAARRAADARGGPPVTGPGLATARPALVRELRRAFQLDRADLDWGIYRFIGLHRRELERWIDGVLAPIADEQLFVDLAAFFARPHEDAGAAPSTRDPDAVTLRWTGAGRHHVRTTTPHRDADIALAGGPELAEPRLRLRVVAAEPDRDDPPTLERRRYLACAREPLRVRDDVLTLQLEFRVPAPDRREQPTQSAICKEIERGTLAAVPPPWRAVLTRPARPGARPTILGHHLQRHTHARASDEQIDRDLGTLLRRDLERFIHTEALPARLAALQRRGDATLAHLSAYIDALRDRATTLIDRLAELNALQLRLLLKQKLVLRTHWCVGLDRVPARLDPEISANADQRAAWARLLGDEAPPDPRAQPGLAIDSSHFSAGFVRTLLAALADVDASTTGLLVAADNAGALALLGRRYRGAVTTLFIDPPYNSGVDGFPYRDRFHHATWLGMMCDRLTAARGLLAPQGLAFITIDSVEVARLRLLCDQVLGADNFLADVAWEKRFTRSNNARRFYSVKDTVLVYRASPAAARLREPRSERSRGYYSNPDGDARGPWISSSYVNPATRAQRPNLVYPICHPRTGAPVEHPTHAWKYNLAAHRAHLRDDRLYWGVDGSHPLPRLKTFLADARDDMVPVDLWAHADTGTTDDGSHALKQKFGAVVFPNPKPPALVRRAITLSPARPAVVLDFFAGSGTTGEATLDLVRERDPDASFILVESGRHFDSVLKPRVLKAAHAATWRAGRPLAGPPVRELLLKCLALESHADTLDNLRAGPDAHATRLGYVLDPEPRLDPRRFLRPWSYTLRIRRDGDVHDSPVDLVETFNYLLGLRVRRYLVDDEPGLLCVAGDDAESRRVLVVWRELAAWPDERLAARCRRALAQLRPLEFDVILVNAGAPSAPDLAPAPVEVRATEDVFHARMFAAP